MHNSATLGPRPARTDRPSEAALRVLRALVRAGGQLTSAELTAELGGHPNTVRPHLDRLVAEGFVDVVALPAVGRGRPARAYRTTIAGRQVAGQDVSTLAGSALLGAVTDELRGSAEPALSARRFGRSWGRRLGAVSQREAPWADLAAAGDGPGPAVSVLDTLAGQGFTPQPEPDGLHLLTCPLLAEAVDAPQVVCSLHQGMLDALSDAPLRLVPFAGPGYCLVSPVETATAADPAHDI